MIVVVIVCALLLTAGATLAVVRAERGPSMLDRTVALDVFTTTLVGGIALEAAWSRRTETIPILVVLALVGFISSVTIARFAAVEPEGEGIIRPGADPAQDDERATDEEMEVADRDAVTGGASSVGGSDPLVADHRASDRDAHGQGGRR